MLDLLNRFLKWLLSLVSDSPPVEIPPVLEQSKSEVLVGTVIPNPSNSENKRLQDVINLSIDDNGVNFIKQWEGFSKKAFWDYKQWSIGYGTKAKYKDEVIDEAEGFKRLKDETLSCQSTLHKLIKVQLTQNMFNALVSFSYNVGTRWILSGSGMLNCLKNGDYQGTANYMKQYNKAGGAVNAGLVNRRKAESSLFLKNYNAN